MNNEESTTGGYRDYDIDTARAEDRPKVERAVTGQKPAPKQQNRGAGGSSTYVHKDDDDDK